MRKRTSLDGLWQWIIDPHERTVTEAKTGYILDESPGYLRDVKNRFVDTLYPPDWRKIRIPCTWNTAKDELRYYDGAVLFQREFEASAPKKGRRIFLQFEAGFYETRVFLNGKAVGEHRGGFTPFQFDVTPLIRNGRNRLNVWVDSRRRPERLPCEVTDWFNYGGIYRSVFLEERDENHLSDFFCRYANGAVVVEIETAGKLHGVAHFRIPALKTDREIEIRNGRGRVRIPCEPVLWTPAAPRLYRVECSFGNDVVTERVGFRTIETRDGRIFLNGSPIKLKGISLHEEAGERGRALTKKDRNRIFDIATELGLNFLRLAHYPHAREMAVEADRRGFLLWEEIPVYWRIQFANKETYADAANQLTELIKRDRNRCSVAMWSVGNETPQEVENRTRFLGDLADLARKLDPSRPVVAAIFAARKGDRIVVADPLAENLDIFGVNRYGGWYEGTYDDFRRLENPRYPDKPILISEFGAAAKKGLHGRKKFAEEYQRTVYKHTLAAIKRNPCVQGCTPWILFDFRSPNRLNRHQNGWNRKGLVDADRKRRKLAFHTYKNWSF